jgi:hypothetical protein
LTEKIDINKLIDKLAQQNLEALNKLSLERQKKRQIRKLNKEIKKED